MDSGQPQFTACCRYARSRHHQCSILLQTSRTEHCVAATPEKHAVGCLDSPADLDHIAKFLKAFRATQLSPPMSRNKSCFQLRAIVAHLFTHFLVEQILLTHMMHQRKSIHVSSLLSFDPKCLSQSMELAKLWNSWEFRDLKQFPTPSKQVGC